MIHLSWAPEEDAMTYVLVHCPDCQGVDVVRYGKQRHGPQRYRCNNPDCPRHIFQGNQLVSDSKPTVYICNTTYFPSCLSWGCRRENPRTASKRFLRNRCGCAMPSLSIHTVRGREAWG